MSSGDRSTFVCCTCSEVSERFVTRAEVGNLYQVCGRCFHLAELGELLKYLPPEDDVRRTAEEGLETLYLTVKNRIEDPSRVQDATQRWKDASCGESEGSSEKRCRRRERKMRRHR